MNRIRSSKFLARASVLLVAATLATSASAKILGTTTFANGHCMVISYNSSNGGYSYVDLGALPTAACTFVDWLLT